MRRPFWNPFRTFFLAAAALLVAAAGFCLWTSRGSRLAITFVVSRIARPEHFSIGRLQGSIARGLVLSDVVMQRPRRWPAGSRIGIHEVTIASEGSWNPRRWRISLWEGRIALPKFVGQISCAYLQGSADAGLRLMAVELADPRKAPPGTRVEARAMQLEVPLLSSPKEWPAVMTGLSGTAPGIAEEVRAERAEGSYSGGLSVSEIEGGRFPWLPESSTILIQHLELAGIPGKLEPLRVRNGRLQLPSADPILFSGQARPMDLDAQLYAKHVDVQTAAAVFPKWEAIKIVTGSFSDVQSTLKGSWREPSFKGHCEVERLQRKGVVIGNGAGTFDLTLSNLGKGKTLKLNGPVGVVRGTLSAKNTTINLQPGRIVFSGPPGNPGYDLHGVSMIEGVRVSIALKGTQDQPDLRLSSDPSVPEEWLLLMLATGRRWRGAETSASQGQISPDLARDFIDFFLLGGLGSRVAQRFGISDISLIFNAQERRMGVATTIADKVEVSYETDQPKPVSTDPQTIGTEPETTTYRVGAGYKITNDSSVRIEGERQLTSESPVATGAAAESTPSLTPAARPKDSIFLKFKKKF